MKKTIVSLGAAAGIALASLVSAPAATAATPTAQTVSSSPVSALGYWQFITWFSNVTACVRAGEDGRHFGSWDAFVCEYRPDPSHANKPYGLAVWRD